MSTSAENRGQFGSKLGFILSAAGSAVGLGNIWKFPGKAYFCGGGAFLIIYLIIVALVGTTVMMAEFTVGRKTHKNAVGAMRELNAKWSWVGGLGVLTGFIHPLLLLSGWRLGDEIYRCLHSRCKNHLG